MHPQKPQVDSQASQTPDNILTPKMTLFVKNSGDNSFLITVIFSFHFAKYQFRSLPKGLCDPIF